MDGPDTLPSDGDAGALALYTLTMGLEGRLFGACNMTTGTLCTISGLSP